jgi:putative pyruvate formate lyase activating enzyme
LAIISVDYWKRLNLPLMKELDHCMICPRLCGVNRNQGEPGYCRSNAGYHISSICIHRGEEPVISGEQGICNIFFSRCNLQCVYCQNYQISRNRGPVEESELTLEEVMNSVIACLHEGVEAVGFVTPSHYVPHVKTIIQELHSRGYHPVTVYNTNGYDSVETLKGLEGLIDVYLPDFKYFDPGFSKKYSAAADYPETARKAITEMYRQKGSTLVISDGGQAITGLIIRHLVLPGLTEDSIAILRWIASELSTSLHISLMSQYYPVSCMTGDPELNRKISPEEYARVEKAMEELGFYKGWMQELDSPRVFNPDFRKENPFSGDK